MIISTGDKNACIHVLFWKLPCSIPMFLAVPVMANQQIFSYGQSGFCKDGCRQPLLHFSDEFSALSCSYLLQVWLSSQTGAASSVEESPAAAFTGARIYPQQPEYSDKHMFLEDFMGYMEASAFPHFYE